MKFSICTPVTYDKDDADNIRMPRYEMFLRCAGSIVSQTYKDFEWVVSDDLSKPSVDSVFIDIKEDSGLRLVDVNVVKLPEKSGRIIARNVAMKEAKGEWICWLDSDDEYSSIYLSAMADAIRLNPDYKIFNFNHLIFDYNYKVHERRFIDMNVQGNVPFPSGVIGAGAFVFHRSVYEDIGPIPELGMWDFSEHALEEFPEIKPYFLKAGTTDQYNSLGNPWGEDYYYFYKMTRKYPSKYLDTALYYVHSHFGHRWSDDPDYVVDPGKGVSWNPNNK